VSDSDVAVMEDTIAERLALGVSQAVAQRQAVDEALAQLAEERTAVMKAVQEQLGGKQGDLFPGEMATKRTKGDSGVAVNSKGETRKGTNVNSDGQQITATKQGVDNFWKWFGNSAAVNEKGQPLVLYHSTNSDFDTFEPGRETINSTTLGDIETQRHGIFTSPDKKFSQEYLRKGEGQNVMQVYASINSPIDLREGISGEDLNAIVAASDGKLTHRDFSYVDPYETWTFFDDEFGQNFVEAAKAAGYDGAIMLEAGPDGNKPATTYVAFDANQIKSATGNLGAFSKTDDRVVFSNKDQTETPQFKRWSKGAPLVALGEKYDFKSGSPVVVEALHGTTNSDLTEFKRSKANIESDFGAGFYGSNTPEDVATNYANEAGADLTSRVERLAEQLENDDEFEGDHGEALRLARARLSDSAPNTMKLFMRFDNPAVLGGKGETYFDYNEEYNEETDGYDEPTGLLVDFVNALDEIGDGLDISMRDLESTKASLFEAAAGEGVKFSELISIVKDGMVDTMGMDDGASGSSEALRQALEEMGFDGVIDTTVLDKFGPRKVKGAYSQVQVAGMSGMTKDTVHFIAFKPTQLKSATGNNGNFDPVDPRISFANKGRVIDRDAAGRARLALSRQIAESMPGQMVGKILDRLYLKSADPAVRQQLRQMKLDIQKSTDTAGALAHEVNQLSMDEREMVSDLIEGELKAGVIPPQHVVNLAGMINTVFRNQTDELVRLGMLSQDAADRWRDAYLPRYYESKLKKSIGDTWADLVGKLNQPRKFSQGIKGKHLMGRGMTNTVPVSDLADWQAKGWEVRDASYDPATSSEVQVWRDFTKAEREKMGEIRDSGFRFVMGYMQTQKDLAIGRMYERLANDPQFSSATAKDGWVEVPSNKVRGTNALLYGKLAGRYVPANLMAQMQSTTELESEAYKAYKKALSWWKANKTVMNPVSHVNNFVSNTTMAHFAGVSYYDVHKYAGAVKDLATSAPMVKEARDAGLFLGSLTDAELEKILPPELHALLRKADSGGIKALKFADALLTFGLRGKMSQAYEFGDRFYKYMLYVDARKGGATPDEAVDHATKYIFTYDDLPKTARTVRDLGLPFFAYTYKAIPALADTALSRPDRFLAPAAIIFMANAIGYAVASAGDDDGWMEIARKYATDAEFRAAADAKAEEEYKALPEWMKGRSALGTKKQIRLHTDDQTGNPVFLDVSRFIPGGDLFDINANAGGIPWLQPIVPSNPLLSIYSSMFDNKDPFFGKDLVAKSDTRGEAAAKRADYLWKLASPAVAVGNNMWDKAVGVAANLYGDEIPYLPDAIGGGNTGVGKDGQAIQPKYALPQMVGLKARPIDMDMAEAVDRSVKRKTLADLEAELRQARRQNNAGYLSDRLFEKRTDAIREKMGRVRDGLTVDGEEKN